MAISTLQGKVLLTGASGFIGGRLRDLLLESGGDVVAIRRPDSPKSKAGRSVRADYARVSDLERVIGEEKPDYVLHVAGVTNGRTYEDFHRGNVMPTRNLLTALRRAHPDTKRFVLVSSIASYGPSASTAPHREENPPRPIEHYGESKLEAENVVEQEAGKVPWTIVRPSLVYGPGDVNHFKLFQTAMLGWNLFYGNRDRRMSMIFVDDCVQGILQAAQHGQAKGKGYFLTNNEQVTWEQLQDEIVRVVQRRVRTVDLPEQMVSLAAIGGELATQIDNKPRLFNLQKARMSAQRAWTCVGDAAERDFGFVAEVDLADGVRRTHEWYVANDWYQSLDPKDLLSVRSLRGLVRRLARFR